MRSAPNQSDLDTIWPDFVRDFRPLAVSLVGESDAPDLLQETYIEAFRMEPRYQERYGNARNPRSRRFKVLSIILRRTAIRWKKSEEKQVRAKNTAIHTWIQKGRQSREELPREEIQRPVIDAEKERLDWTIAHAGLSPLMWECLQDYRFGLPTSHSAQRLSISEGTARAHLLRAWRAIRVQAEVEMYHRMEEPEEEQMTDEQENRIVWRILSRLEEISGSSERRWGILPKDVAPGDKPCFVKDPMGRLIAYATLREALAAVIPWESGYRVCEIGTDGRPVENDHA